MGIWLMIFAVVVIVVLLGIAAYYLLQVRELNARREVQRKEVEQFAIEKREHANLSIQVIAGSLSEDQMTLTEGAIRISKLLDTFGLEPELQEEFTAFHQLAKATEHIPIMDQWKQLKTKQKLVFDKQRTELEVVHKEFVLDAAKRIKGRTF